MTEMIFDEYYLQDDFYMNTIFPPLSRYGYLQTWACTISMNTISKHRWTNDFSML